MEPNSKWLVVLLVLAAIGCLVAAIRLRHLAVKIVGGLLVILTSATAGMAVVNDYYGYYQTWSQLTADLSGNYSGFAAAPTGARLPTGGVQAGQLRSITLPGAASGISRGGLVYLPPQYFEKQYQHTRFPVVELLHGTPGRPSDWVVHLHVTSILDHLIGSHAMGPVILVMPTSNNGRQFQECVNAPGALDDTYISQDVPTVVRHLFRASTVPAEWGVAGYSSGGYCAANLALRHPGGYGAAGMMDGYVRPTDGPAAAALHYNQAAENANDPLMRASRLSRNASPLPSFWLSAGTGNGADMAAARAFVSALHGVEQVPIFRELGAAHNFYAWRPALPHLLSWMWTQIAPPSLRVRFPVAGPPESGTLSVPKAAVSPRHQAQSRCRLPCVARGLSAPGHR